MHFEGNIFYCVIPSCITFYLAVSGSSFPKSPVEADLNSVGSRGSNVLPSFQYFLWCEC